MLTFFPVFLFKPLLITESSASKTDKLPNPASFSLLDTACVAIPVV